MALEFLNGRFTLEWNPNFLFAFRGIFLGFFFFQHELVLFREHISDPELPIPVYTQDLLENSLRVCIYSSSLGYVSGLISVTIISVS